MEGEPVIVEPGSRGFQVGIAGQNRLPRLGVGLVARHRLGGPGRNGGGVGRFLAGAGGGGGQGRRFDRHSRLHLGGDRTLAVRLNSNVR